MGRGFFFKMKSHFYQHKNIGGIKLKNLVIALVVILIAAGVFFVMKQMAIVPMESEYFDFKLGSKYNNDMKVTEESYKFKVKDEIYYSIFSKKPFEADASIEVIIKNTADMSKVLFSEKLVTMGKKVVRPINPVNSDVLGKYVIEVTKDGKAIARKVFEIVETMPATAVVSGKVDLEIAPATSEVKAEATAAPVTAEVKAIEAPKTEEAKTK